LQLLFIFQGNFEIKAVTNMRKCEALSKPLVENLLKKTGTAATVSDAAKNFADGFFHALYCMDSF
jgi:hypothetical protein